MLTSEDKQSKDLFSNHSQIYSQARPEYPQELFEYLASLVSNKELAWDAACGNGQSAFRLSEFFQRVIATDMSSQQLMHAVLSPKISYYVEPVARPNSSLIKENSVDLITVALAIHWFPLKEFYERAAKVLKPGGLIACWGYLHPKVNTEVDSVMLNLEEKYFRMFDAPELNYIWNEYLNFPWPFKPPKDSRATIDGIDRSFSITKSINLDQYCAYLRSQSSAQLYLEKKGKDAVNIIYADLLKAWGGDPRVYLDIIWPIFLRVGCI